GADEGAGRPEGEPGRDAVVDGGVEPVARQQRQVAAPGNVLEAGRGHAAGGEPGRGEVDVLAERGLRVRVAEAQLPATIERGPGEDLGALAPRLPHVLEEHRGGAGRRDREDVVVHVGTEEREVQVNAVAGRQTAPLRRSGGEPSRSGWPR